MVDLLILIPPILLAITFHEYAHGWMALKFGDPTAKMLGRLSLNPLVHLDPIGTLMLFIVHFGWAKPVPVDPRYFSDPKRQMIWVALAGPIANMILAFISGILIIGFSSSNLMFNSQTAFFANMLIYSLQINLALAIFNMLPIPPLDGSKILRGLLPYRYEYISNTLEQFGPWILFSLILIGMMSGFSLFWLFMSPFVRFFSSLFTLGMI
ncbi:MAG: site-2 protease family protein [Candidatus Marinimicrobia bacterium]|jgi:Zn-dependent protease|nr:site-2 protease family protein [Candidatus Neomarinimicrobiota bacterium]|tara:strand:- start:464 stop:1093 length:630 start_codon:yes stop_codon:yes gene_type:complete